jgi:hypothetical protein
MAIIEERGSCLFLTSGTRWKGVAKAFSRHTWDSTSCEENSFIYPDSSRTLMLDSAGQILLNNDTDGGLRIDGLMTQPAG